MIKMKKVVKEIKEVDDIFCNKCGNSCKNEMNYNGLIEAQVQGAYDSSHLGDGTFYKFSLCEKCLKELFDTFTISPLFEDTEECDCSCCSGGCGEKS